MTRGAREGALIGRLAFCGLFWACIPLFATGASIAQVAGSSATPASGQEVSPDSQSRADIEVRGRKDDPVRSFVAQMTQRGPTDQIGRWKDGICPAFSGLSDGQAATIERRMAATWQTVGLSPPRHCLTSLIIIFSNDATDVATDLSKRYPMVLRADGEWLLRRFVKSDRPVRWLTISNECGFGCTSGSNIFMETAPAFSAMLIIVDGKQVAGITLDEIADYLAMVSLINPPQKGATPQGSIMSLFDHAHDATVALSLTTSDRELLTSLYRSSTNLPLSLQRAEIVRRIKRSEKNADKP